MYISKAQRRAFLGLGLASLLAISSVHAACPRADVEFYLSKGFTPEQIVELCRGQSVTDMSATTSPTSKPVAPAPVKKMSPTLHVLKSSIEAEDIEISDTALSFTNKTCVVTGYDYEGYPDQACPMVRYSVLFAGLKIQGIERPDLFMPREILISGKVDRKILTPYSSEKRAKVSRLLQQTTAGIPINNEAEAEQVLEKLRSLI